MEHQTPPTPTPEQVRAARETAGLSQAAAAALVYLQPRTWRAFEAGTRTIDPAHWELWRIKATLKNPTNGH